MKRFVLIVDTDQAGQRLDRFLADARPEVSRSEAQRDIREGRVALSGEPVTRPSHRLRENDEIAWEAVARAPLAPRPIPLEVLHEDAHIVVVNKPIGLVAHPGAGTEAPTLVEGLLVDRDLPPSDDPVRPGIVHRLDKETSGVIVVAKTAAALTHLQQQFAARTVGKTYVAVVDGLIAEDEATIDAPIGRDPAYPRRMSIQPRGKPAQTDIQVLKQLEDSTLLLAHPRTGRTHQIRVHLKYIGHTVLGDSVYGPARPREQTKRHTSSQRDPCAEGAGERLMLHAWRLTVNHPETNAPVTFEALIPPEFPQYSYEAAQ